MSEKEIIQNEMPEMSVPSTPGSPDPFLVFLVNQIEAMDGEMPIMLWVQGGVVSGELISHRRYMVRTFNSLKHMRHLSPARGHAVLDGLIDAFESYEADHPEHAASAGTEVVPQYLQLQNAVLSIGGSTQSLDSAWRVRLDAINAWMLGAATNGT